jgi:hypothetical protein
MLQFFYLNKRFVKDSEFHKVINRSFRQYSLKQTELSPYSHILLKKNLDKQRTHSQKKSPQSPQKTSLFPIFILNVYCSKEECDICPDMDGYLITLKVCFHFRQRLWTLCQWWYSHIWTYFFFCLRSLIFWKIVCGVWHK